MAIGYVNVATSSGGVTTSATLTIPTNTTTNNVMIAFVAHSNTLSAVGNYTWPSGWTMLDRLSSASHPVHLEVGWRAWQSGDANATVTLAETGSSYVSHVVSYSGMDTTTPFIDHAIKDGGTDNGGAGTATTTTSITNTDTAAWRISAFSRVTATDSGSWGSYSPADTERADTQSAVTWDTHLAVADSNAGVSTGGTTVTATPSVAGYGKVVWAGLLKPSPLLPQSIDARSAAVTRASIW